MQALPQIAIPVAAPMAASTSVPQAAGGPSASQMSDNSSSGFAATLRQQMNESSQAQAQAHSQTLPSSSHASPSYVAEGGLAKSSSAGKSATNAASSGSASSGSASSNSAVSNSGSSNSSSSNAASSAGSSSASSNGISYANSNAANSNPTGTATSKAAPSVPGSAAAIGAAATANSGAGSAASSATDAATSATSNTTTGTTTCTQKRKLDGTAQVSAPAASNILLIAPPVTVISPVANSSLPVGSGLASGISANSEQNHLVGAVGGANTTLPGGTGGASASGLPAANAVAGSATATTLNGMANTGATNVGMAASSGNLRFDAMPGSNSLPVAIQPKTAGSEIPLQSGMKPATLQGTLPGAPATPLTLNGASANNAANISEMKAALGNAAVSPNLAANASSVASHLQIDGTGLSPVTGSSSLAGDGTGVAGLAGTSDTSSANGGVSGSGLGGYGLGSSGTAAATASASNSGIVGNAMHNLTSINTPANSTANGTQISSAGSPPSSGTVAMAAANNFAGMHGVAPGTLSAGAPSVAGQGVAGASAINGHVLTAPGGGTTSSAMGARTPVTPSLSGSDAFAALDHATSDPGHILHMTPNQLAVGVSDPQLGWLEVRADRISGQLTAQIAADSASSHAVLAASLPDMASFLQQQRAGVQSLAVASQLTGHAGNPSGQHTGQQSGQQSGQQFGQQASQGGGQQPGALFRSDSSASSAVASAVPQPAFSIPAGSGQIFNDSGASAGQGRYQVSLHA